MQSLCVSGVATGDQQLGNYMYDENILILDKEKCSQIASDFKMQFYVFQSLVLRQSCSVYHILQRFNSPVGGRQLLVASRYLKVAVCISTLILILYEKC